MSDEKYVNGDVEGLLGSLRPLPADQRDQLLFAAGQQAGRQAVRRKYRLGMAAALLPAMLLGMHLLLMPKPQPAKVTEYVYLPAPASSDESIATASAFRPAVKPGPNSYAVLRQKVLSSGSLDVLPVSAGGNGEGEILTVQSLLEEAQG